MTWIPVRGPIPKREPEKLGWRDRLGDWLSRLVDRAHTYPLYPRYDPLKPDDEQPRWLGEALRVALDDLAAAQEYVKIIFPEDNMSTNRFVIEFDGTKKKMKAVVPQPGTSLSKAINDLHTEMTLCMYCKEFESGITDFAKADKVLIAGVGGSQRVQLPVTPTFTDWFLALSSLDLQKSWDEYHEAMDAFLRRSGDIP